MSSAFDMVWTCAKRQDGQGKTALAMDACSGCGEKTRAGKAPVICSRCRIRRELGIVQDEALPR